MVPGQAVEVSPWNLLEMQIPRPHLRPAESDTLCVRTSSLWFNKPPSDLDTPLKFENHWSQSVVYGPLGIPETFSGNPQRQNNFHSNTKNVIWLSILSRDCIKEFSRGSMSYEFFLNVVTNIRIFSKTDKKRLAKM